MKHTLIDKHYGKLEVEFSDHNRPFLHFVAKSFSPSIYKEMIDDFLIVIESMKAHGYHTLYTLVNKDAKSTRKFQVMFGLEPCAVVGDEYILSSIDIGELNG